MTRLQAAHLRKYTDRRALPLEPSLGTISGILAKLAPFMTFLFGHTWEACDLGGGFRCCVHHQTQRGKERQRVIERKPETDGDRESQRDKESQRVRERER